MGGEDRAGRGRRRRGAAALREPGAAGAASGGTKHPRRSSGVSDRKFLLTGPKPAASVSRVAVLKGGRSLERQVSLRSGARVQDALQRLGHEVRPVDVGPGLVRS